MAIHTKLQKSEIIEILENYSIGTLKSFNFFTEGVENTNIKLITSRNKYVLRYVEEKDVKQILFQTEVIDFLTLNNIKTPKIIKTKDKKDFIIYKNKPIVIFQFAEGNHIKKINKKLFVDIIKKISLLQKKLIEFHPLNRPWIKYATDLSYEEFLLSKIKSNKYNQEFNKLVKELKNINDSKLRKSIIHGDLTKVNLLAKNNKVTAILDFDDVRQDYFVYDIAIFIVQFCFPNNKLDADLIKIFSEEYGKLITLSNEEKKALLPFMKKRLLSATLYFQYFLDTDKGDKNQNILLRDCFWKRYLEIKELKNYSDIVF